MQEALYNLYAKGTKLIGRIKCRFPEHLEGVVDTLAERGFNNYTEHNSGAYADFGL